jgi:hypothetical protein
MKSAAVRAVLLLGVAYLVAGLVFGELAGRAASQPVRVAWRWAAWVISAAAFAAHIVYEQVRLRSSPKITALHVSSAAALGAFGLAVAANVHAQTVSPRQHSLLLVLSLAIWPAMTALPAFIVALVAAMLFARVWRNARGVSNA